MASLENIALTDIDWPDGSENIGGTGQKLWFAPRGDFAKGGIPAVPQNPATLEEAAQVDGANFQFKTGKGWNTLYVTRDTGGITGEPQGEMDGKSFLNKYAFVTPGNQAKALGFSRYINNTPLIMIVQEADGTLRMMGSDVFGVSFDSITPTTGATTAERKQVAFECSFPSVAPAPIVTNYSPANFEASGSSSTSAGGV